MIQQEGIDLIDRDPYPFFLRITETAGGDHRECQRSYPLLLSQLKTLPVAVQAFVGSYVKQWNMILAAALLAIVPMVIVFLIAQRQIMDGMIESAVKG